MKFHWIIALMASFVVATPTEYSTAAVTSVFGTGSNQFTMVFESIGNAGNAPDTTGVPRPAGSVGYNFLMGKYEVSRDMIAKFNASQPLNITMQDMTAYGGNLPNKPATGVTWNEAARFINWLNTSTGGNVAYRYFDGNVNDNILLWDPVLHPLDYDPNNPFRSRRAKYFLPDYNEWYKAAYYAPNLGGTGGYVDYPTGSDAEPVAVTGGVLSGTAVYSTVSLPQIGPADITNAGGLSAYNIMGMGGNAYEWQESAFDLVNDDPAEFRSFRGGDWSSTHHFLRSVNWSSIAPPDYDYNIGFRVGAYQDSPPAVPEPSSMAMLMLGLGGYLGKRWTRRL
jgi:formylglycine-generating enzyme required for sulfatase activity